MPKGQQLFTSRHVSTS